MCFFSPVAIIGVLNSPRYPNSVFVLCDTEEHEFQPVGTCFAISPSHLLSCQHFMRGRAVNYLIAPVVVKENGNIHFPTPPCSVKVVRFNKQMDYAILELQSTDLNLTPIPISLEPVISDIDLKLFHCPIAAFNDNSNSDVGVLTRWLKSGYSKNHHMVCEGGAFRGSSGAPYVMRNGFAIGIHIESINETQQLEVDDVKAMSSLDEQIEIISDTVNSNAENYAALSTVLLFNRCPKLIEQLKEWKIIDN
jgi:hypothetical protein